MLESQAVTLKDYSANVKVSSIGSSGLTLVKWEGRLLQQAQLPACCRAPIN